MLNDRGSEPERAFLCNRNADTLGWMGGRVPERALAWRSIEMSVGVATEEEKATPSRAAGRVPERRLLGSASSARPADAIAASALGSVPEIRQEAICRLCSERRLVRLSGSVPLR